MTRNSLENTATNVQAVTPAPEALSRFVQDLASDIRQAKTEVQGDKLAMQQDVQDGKLVRELRSEEKSGKIHPKDRALFDLMLDTVLHNAHRDLSLETQFIRDTNKRSETETKVLTAACTKFGLPLPDLTIVESKSTIPGGALSLAGDQSAAHSELQGDIQARTTDDHDMAMYKTINSEVADPQLAQLAGVGDMSKALQKEFRNSAEDKRDELQIYQINTEMRESIDRMALHK